MGVEEMTAEGAVTEVTMAAEGAAPKVVPIEILAEVSKSPRLPRPMPSSTKESPKNKKGTQVMTPQQVHASPKKHPQKDKLTA